MNGCTFTTSGFRIKSVSGPATGQPEARVRPNRVIAALRAQAIVIIKQAFVNVCVNQPSLQINQSHNLVH